MIKSATCLVSLFSGHSHGTKTRKRALTC